MDPTGIEAHPSLPPFFLTSFSSRYHDEGDISLGRLPSCHRCRGVRVLVSRRPADRRLCPALIKSTQELLTAPSVVAPLAQLTARRYWKVELIRLSTARKWIGPRRPALVNVDRWRQDKKNVFTLPSLNEKIASAADYSQLGLYKRITLQIEPRDLTLKQIYENQILRKFLFNIT